MVTLDFGQNWINMNYNSQVFASVVLWLLCLPLDPRQWIFKGDKKSAAHIPSDGK
jgi:hypothetical protein